MVDFGRTASDYGQHRAGFPNVLWDRLRPFGIGAPGQRVLDIGTGTGTIARGFALRGCDVTGLDRSVEMMAEAARLDQMAGATARYVVATAEETGLPPASFDVVCAGQCWHWFDRARAANEMRRVLRPGGALVIAHYDWIPLPGNVAEATEALILEYNPAWGYSGRTGIYPDWPTDVAIAGFGEIETFSTDVPALYTHESWRGRIRASAGVGVALSTDRVAAFDRELADVLAHRFPADPLEVPHRLWALVCRAP